MLVEVQDVEGEEDRFIGTSFAAERLLQGAEIAAALFIEHDGLTTKDDRSAKR
ncbi:hypothetical protein GCM10010520_51670 [Rhizobium viscosum]